MKRSPAPSQPATVEIVGVAGAGKSTLAEVVCVDRGFGELDDTLRLRQPRHLVLVAHSIPRLARLIKKWIGARHRPTLTEVKLVIYLMEWSRRPTRSPGRDPKVTLMDQGPVYALARLGTVEPPVAGTEPHGDWWTRMVEFWADRLDAVIWVDAPNDILWQRISNRSQGHEIKGGSQAAAMAFVNRYRASYESVLAAMERPGGPLVLRYDTSRMSAEEIASEATVQLGHLHPRPGPAAWGRGAS